MLFCLTDSEAVFGFNSIRFRTTKKDQLDWRAIFAFTRCIFTNIKLSYETFSNIFLLYGFPWVAFEFSNAKLSNFVPSYANTFPYVQKLLIQIFLILFHVVLKINRDTVSIWKKTEYKLFLCSWRSSKAVTQLFCFFRGTDIISIFLYITKNNFANFWQWSLAKNNEVNNRNLRLATASRWYNS